MFTVDAAVDNPSRYSILITPQYSVCSHHVSRQSIAMNVFVYLSVSESVCLCVCLSVCLHPKTSSLIFNNFLCMLPLPVTMALVALRCGQLPALIGKGKGGNVTPA